MQSELKTSKRTAAFSIEPARCLANLPPARLYEESIRRQEAAITEHGALLAVTGEHTGRSPNDRFVVRHVDSGAPASAGSGGSSSATEVNWGAVNRPIASSSFDRLLAKAQRYAEDRDLFIFEGFAGADPDHRIRVRVVTEYAWHCLFAHNMFLRQAEPDPSFEPDFTVVDLPGVEADPEQDGTNSSTFIVLDLEQATALIGGTQYAGEIKKSVFSVMNYLLPRDGVLSMHCSANYGADRLRDVALFFGLSGTGKTTLSADPERTLIGDDEHGWGDQGVFNVEGGCYAKVIRLDPAGEPAIFATTRQFGTILENVVADPATRRLDLDDDSLTENTRASYPISHLEAVDLTGVAGHPRSVVFLTCDAFGVLPPISRLDEAQAMYHFLSGYTAKVAGTERGVTEPSATFSACFGAPFMPLHPGFYATMLGEKLRRHGSKVWLVNTGWTGGGFGTGRRIKLSDTRRMISAALARDLDAADYRVDPVFGLSVPQHIEGVTAGILEPRSTWRDQQAYDAQLRRLATMFRDNFVKFEDGVDGPVKAAGPSV